MKRGQCPVISNVKGTESEADGLIRRQRDEVKKQFHKGAHVLEGLPRGHCKIGQPLTLAGS